MDGIFMHRDSKLLVLLPFVIMGIFLLRGGLSFLYNYLMQSAAQKLVMNLRNRLYGHILELPVGHFSSHSSGALISRVFNDTQAVEHLVSLTIKDLFVEAATAAALVGVAFWRSWELTLVALVLLPTAFWGVGRLGRLLRRISRRIQEKAASITEALSEGFTGIRVIKAFQRQEEERRRFRDRTRDFYREHMRAVRTRQAVTVLMDATAGLGIAFVIYFGGSMVIRGAMSPGEFFSFLTAVFMVYTPARRLSRVSAALEQARGPLERIFQTLALRPEPQGGRTMGALQEAIEFKGVSFRYPGQREPALKDISFTARKGEVVAIVGESGSGKSTLVNLLLRFYSPTNGAIYMDGLDIQEASLDSLRAQFGVVSQEVVLFNDTVRANIALGNPRASWQELEAASRAAHAHEFITGLPQGYDTVVGEKGLRLSGGQRQRLSIARAILRDPPVLILDEATSSLDSHSEALLQEALERLMQGRTTFVIAHRLSTIRKAHKVLVLKEGRLVGQGSHEELLRDCPEYRRLYELQFSLNVP
jgi:subfamily B ATP-binding cassette protein MsbA